MESKEIPELNH